MSHSIKIGLALGSGSARGWAHIGVIRVLEQAGIRPDIVCGTSIGALIGAAYAAGELDRLEPWVSGLTWQTVVGLLDVSMDGGLIKGDKVFNFFRSRFQDRDIAELGRNFGAVATELKNGREVWLREGSVLDAVRASLAVPGLFRPALHEGRLLVDGALVNPVPVSLCRAMGADVVIAVDLNWDLMGRRLRAARSAAGAAAGPGAQEAQEDDDPSLFDRIASGWELIKTVAATGGNNATGRTEPELPSMLEVLTTSLNIMQVRITSSRLAGEPADILIRPRLGNIAQMDYHRAGLAMAEGRRVAELALPALSELLDIPLKGQQ